MADESAKQIDLIIADLVDFSERQVIGLALDIAANLQEATPVKTNWARANWIPSIAAPYIVDDEFKGEPTPGMVTARRAIQEEGANKILGWRLESGPIFVTNNVPYIGALNAGHSPQAPPGFVQKAIDLTLALSAHTPGRITPRASFGYRPGL